MTGSELGMLKMFFKKEDFNYKENEMYCGHEVVDERDGYVTAKAFGFKIGTCEYRWEYCTKTLKDIQNITPKRAPQPVTQKGI